MTPDSEDDAGRHVRRGRFGLLAAAQASAVLFVASLLGLLVWKMVHQSSGAGLVAAIERGDRPDAPGFDLPLIWDRSGAWPERARGALADKSVSLQELGGTPVVLNFWASWCIPCKDEAPDLAAEAAHHRDRVAFLGLDVQDFVLDARRFLNRQDVPYPSVRDGEDDVYKSYGLTGLPETFYIDARGRILAHAVGAVSRAELERDIALLLTSKR